MEWADEGVVLGVRRLGETSVILEVMTLRHGRHAGVVRGGRATRLQPVLQPGNSVSLVWRARLEEQLGIYTVEPRQMRAAGYMGSALALNLLGAATELTRLLPERDPHPDLHDSLALLCDQIGHPAIGPGLLALFELAILAELGFGLDLGRCAATGGTDELIYVSPKSGCAVCAAAGAPWKERLLPLPPFLAGATEAAPSTTEVIDALRVTGFFLQRNVFGPRGLVMPGGRARAIALLQRSGPVDAGVGAADPGAVAS